MNMDKLGYPEAGREARPAPAPGCGAQLNTEYRSLVFLLLSALFLLPCASTHAFPPAPHHLLYGLVRDERGNPLTGEATIILETSEGVQLKARLVPGLEPGVNYELKAPMDAGVARDLYKATALSPAAAFTLKVRIGNTDYLPIQMLGNIALLGGPAQRTRIDLTLGEDSDGDGLPDAWERAINSDISKVGPDDDSDGDGLSNLAEYIAGTYAFDPENGFALSIVGMNEGRPQLEFTAIRGRSYTILGSSDLKTWSIVTFRVPADGAEASSRRLYQATDVRLLKVEADPPAAGATGIQFFKLLAQ